MYGHLSPCEGNQKTCVYAADIHDTCSPYTQPSHVGEMLAYKLCKALMSKSNTKLKYSPVLLLTVLVLNSELL
jgi:hypothetical protein